MRLIFLLLFIFSCTTNKNNHSDSNEATPSRKGYDIQGVLRECPAYNGPPAAPAPDESYRKYSDQCIARGYESFYCQSIPELRGVFLCSERIQQ